MKVLFDSQIFGEQKIGGISRYYYELIKNSNDYSTELSIKYSNNLYLNQDEDFSKIGSLSEYKIISKIENLNFKGKNRIINLLKKKLDKNKLNQKISLKTIQKGNYDIFHPTYYNPYFLSAINKPFVVTVYDMIHEKFPHYFPKNDRTTINKKLLCDNANAIIAISESTKKDLIEYFSIDENKIKVIHLSSNLNILKATPPKGITKEYILFIGSRFGYKNFKNFILGSIKTLNENKELSIVCTGSPLNKEEQTFLNELNILNRVHICFVNDEELTYLYSNAVLFIFPSMYEGFGIPALEAFTCNCPAILSDTSSLKEIGEDAAVYIDPNDVKDIENKISNVVNDRSLREKLKLKGKEQLKKFSWSKCRKEHLIAYEAIL